MKNRVKCGICGAELKISADNYNPGQNRILCMKCAEGRTMTAKTYDPNNVKITFMGKEIESCLGLADGEFSAMSEEGSELNLENYRAVCTEPFGCERPGCCCDCGSAQMSELVAEIEGLRFRLNAMADRARYELVDSAIDAEIIVDGYTDPPINCGTFDPEATARATAVKGEGKIDV